MFPSNFVSVHNNDSPVLANRRVSGTNVANQAISSSRENLIAAATTLISKEKEAPNLPPKPGKSHSLCSAVIFPFNSNSDQVFAMNFSLIWNKACTFDRSKFILHTLTSYAHIRVVSAYFQRTLHFTGKNTE